MVVWLRTLYFWDITQYHWVICSPCFEGTPWLHLQQSTQSSRPSKNESIMFHWNDKNGTDRQNWSTRRTSYLSATLSTLNPIQCLNICCHENLHSHTFNNYYKWTMGRHFLITLYSWPLVSLNNADLYLFMRSIPTSVIMVPNRDRNWFTGYSVNAIFWTAGNLL